MHTSSSLLFSSLLVSPLILVGLSSAQRGVKEIRVWRSVRAVRCFEMGFLGWQGGREGSVPWVGVWSTLRAVDESQGNGGIVWRRGMGWGWGRWVRYSEVGGMGGIWGGIVMLWWRERRNEGTVDMDTERLVWMGRGCWFCPIRMWGYLKGRLVEELNEMCDLVVCGKSTRKGLFLLWHSWGRRGWKQLQGPKLWATARSSSRGLSVKTTIRLPVHTRCNPATANARLLSNSFSAKWLLG